MKYTNQYKAFLRPEKRVSKSLMKPRNIYRITTYKGGEPATKQGLEARYIFVIGIVDEKIHAIKLNEIMPADFTQFITKLRDMRVPLTENTMLHLFLKKFSRDGSSLFSSYIKNNPKIYSKKLANYRTYFINKIQNVYEIRFEQDALERLFSNRTNRTEQRDILRDEINEGDLND